MICNPNRMFSQECDAAMFATQRLFIYPNVVVCLSCGAVVWGARRDFTIKTYGRGFESGRERFFARQLLHTWYALSEWIRYLESIKNNECKLSCLRD